MAKTGLKRSVGQLALIFYGTGTMVGAGFYALVGKVAGEAGLLLPLALLVAAIVAGFAVLSYGELVRNYPLSGGEAVYVQRAFNRPWLGGAVGWAVMLTGIVSAAALGHAFANYLAVFVSLPDWLVLTTFTLVLGGITAWGIRESVLVAVAITVLEILGLLVVAGLLLFIDDAPSLPADWPALTGTNRADTSWAALLPGVISGGFLAIYAFIGFEDMVNIAEEVHEPERVLPRSLIAALLITTLLYLLVGGIAVLSVPLELLTESDAPLAEIVRAQGEGWAMFIGLAGLLAGVNGALVQFVMASRVMYGMSTEKMAPRIFDKVNSRTRTPLMATLAVTLAVGMLALAFPIETLARVTSFIILIVFGVMHASVIRLRFRSDAAWQGRLPAWVPALGLLVVVALLVFQVESLTG